MSIFNFCGFRQRKSTDIDIETPETPDLVKRNDEFCASCSVYGLGDDNFKDFLSKRDLAVVFFYHPYANGINTARNNFVQAAEKKKSNHTFAAVDCLSESQVCCKESVTNFPFYKLYSKGRYIGFNDDPTYLSAAGLNQWLDTFHVY